MPTGSTTDPQPSRGRLAKPGLIGLLLLALALLLLALRSRGAVPTQPAAQFRTTPTQVAPEERHADVLARPAAPLTLPAATPRAQPGLPTAPPPSAQLSALPAAPQLRLTAPVPQPPGSLATLRVPILIYHYLSANPNPRDRLRTGLSIAPDVFDAQCRFLATHGYTTITLDDYLAARAGLRGLPPHPVILTFDDGYRDFYTNAYPILQRYQFRATIYIISDKIGQPNYMTWPQLRALAASPLITIGAHTRTHAQLDAVPLTRAQDEIAGSKQILEQQLGIAIAHFCYPYGKYNAAVKALVAAAGFRSATTTRRRSATAADDPLLIPRIEIVGGTTLTQFAADLQLAPRGRPGTGQQAIPPPTGPVHHPRPRGGTGSH